jgi:polyhydroxyalkanoate synthase
MARKVCCCRLGPYCRGGKPAGTEPVSVLDQLATCGRDETWLEPAEAHSSSWWSDWQAWNEAQDGRLVPPRQIGGGKLTPIEDAPGSYVRVKS